MAEIFEKIRKRLPNGELYETLRMQKRMIKKEQDFILRRLMLALYKKKRDVYFRGGVKGIGISATLIYITNYSHYFTLNLHHGKQP